MQLLSPNLMIAAVTAPPAVNPIQQLLVSPEIQELRLFFYASLGVSQFVRVFAYWLASKALADPDKATFPSALKLWVSYFLFWVVSFFAIFVVVGLIGVTTIQTRFALPMMLTILGLAAIFFLFVILFIPMNIYSIGIIRSLGFLIMAAFMTFIIMIPVNVVLLRFTGGDRAMAWIQGALADSQGKPDVFLKTLIVEKAPDEINHMLDEAEGLNGRKLSLPEREAMVATIQQKLTARKATLAPGNTAAQAAFQMQLNRYLRFRASVVNEMNFQPGAARPH